MDGLLLVDKPSGVSSFDVIRQIRRVADTRKIGHTGTLDPEATGLLPLVIGKCTKLAKFLTLDVKEYEFELELGVETETGDVEGDVVRKCPWEHVTEQALEEVCTRFLGEIEQVPPIYSAIKVDGKRAYELAREGKDFELEARPVSIESLGLVSFDPPRARLHTRCEAGTYVRALVRDIGGELGTCAYTTAIRRVGVGGFSLSEATPLEEITPENVGDILLRPIELMRDMKNYVATPEECTALSYGQNIQPADFELELDEYIAVVDGDGELAAVTVARDLEEGRVLRPKRVLKAK
jgi:tRNA pseudouridine55 synthase